MNRLIRFSLLIASVSLMITLSMSRTASATTYYIAANGSDSNSGTSKTSPWLHAPGMPSCTATCASKNPQPGDQFIFRGGDTWHFGDSSSSPFVGSGGWTWNWSGSDGNPIYVGVDQTWYSSGSFSRPILSGDNPLWSGKGFPASCTHANSNSQVSMSAGGTLSYVTLDNFEFSGFCWTGQASINGTMLNAPGGDMNIIVSNLYFHGWTMTSSASDNFASIQSYGGGPAADFNQFVGLVIDGSDSPHFAAGDANCQWFANDPAGCASGQGFNGTHVYDIHQSIIRYVSNMDVDGNCHTRHDNLYEYLYDSFASGSLQQHPNVMNCLGGATNDPLYFYNNILRHTFVTEDIYFAVRTSVYVFNNVFYDNMNSGLGVLPGGCIRFNSVSNSASSQTAYIANNTFGDTSCDLKFEVANSPLTPWNGTGYFQNNHLIGYTNLAGVYICNTEQTCKITDNGNELYQSISAANGQGYTASDNYAPTSANGSTVGVGGNLTSSCPTFSSDSALCSGTSDASTEEAGNGGQIAVNPAIPLVPRPSSGAWDVGAYEFGGVQPPAPPTGLSVVVQ
jgi:hypothetical protein